ncbi:TonB-dependent receptor [Leptospira gomenensis]|uniref:TonB-dependent receptor n=1 Tax=Leptospira gomenensis TaxID=2484974 RepID=A0A5F1YDU6_9LEPT|nr:TonB-dependent receptor plug domain-containing protein [Leptospira gomenensis]TGK36449.1 TonB-dependent receptor [Leptospira gomenensis]TGK38278.1 TonB-dependent receptor [Leptospira gomenensis]TGK46019.1 TonB-dependent receptor [Leptospira gomenensis]TGK65283.1 TonB-dependent receptor [Leptospira gomenensis]
MGKFLRFLRNGEFVGLCAVSHNVRAIFSDRRFVSGKFYFSSEKVLFRFFCFVLVFHSPLFSQKSLNAEIFVSEETGNEAVGNTPIVFQEIGKYLITNGEGSVRVSFPSPGTYHLRIMTPQKVFKKSVTVDYDGQKIFLFIGKTAVGEINVLGDRLESLSRYTLQQEEIKRLPGAQNDALKSIQTLPGIAAVPPIGLSSSSFNNLVNSVGNSNPYSNSERGFLVMRGGGTLSNGYYLDGFPMSYPYHLGDQSSVLNNNIIKSFNVYSGAFPVQFGFATGGIIDIRTPDSVAKTSSVINLNTFLSDVYHQNRISERLFAIVSARKSYPNFTLLKLYPEGIPADAKYADYEDYQAKFNWKPASNHNFTVLLFGAKDKQQYTKRQDEFENGKKGLFGASVIETVASGRPPVGLERLFRTSGFRYSYNNQSWFETSFSVSNNYFRENFEVDFKNPLTAEQIFGLTNVTSQSLNFVESNTRIELIQRRLTFRFGGQYRDKTIQLQGEDIKSSNATFLDFFNSLLDSNRQFRALIEGDRIQTRELAGFAELEFKLGGLSILPGYRHDYYDKAHERRDAFRGRVEYEIQNSGTKLLAGTGEHFNAPLMIEQFSSRSGNPNLKMERSIHSSAGIEQRITSNYLIKVEGFHNQYSNLVTPDAYIQNPYQPNNEKRDIVNRPEDVLDNPFVVRNMNYSNSRDGFSRGVEFFLKANPGPGRRFFGWISYTNSVSKRNNHQPQLSEDETRQRNIDNRDRRLLYQMHDGGNYLNYYDDGNFELLADNDKLLLYDYDRTHILNIVFAWKFGQDWQIGSKYTYLTNVPITPITDSSKAGGIASTGINLYTPTYSEYYNSGRWPDFHQLDIRVDRFLNYQWGYVNTYLELINFFGNRNQISESFNNFSPYSRNATHSLLTGTTPSNPDPVYNSNYIESKAFGGTVKYYPLISVGMQIKF